MIKTKNKSFTSRKSRSPKVFGKPTGRTNDRYIGLIVERTPDIARLLNKIAENHTSQREGVQKAIEEYANKL